MKLILGLLAAAAGLVSAAQPAADVYLLPTRESSTSAPSIPRTLARMILLQRIASPGKSFSFSDLPESYGIENAVALMNEFGKDPPVLFGEDSSPKQLVVMLEGLTSKQIKDAKKQLRTSPAFSISDPPSARAHEKLLSNDFYNAGVTKGHECTLKEVTNPFEEQCWNGKSVVAKYNVQKNPEIVKELAGQMERLSSLARSGEMQTAILLLPHDKESTGSASWSDKPQELRRRQAEDVLADGGATTAAPTSAAENPTFYISRAAVPACFTSEENCVSGTRNCSEHGVCRNKYAKADGSEGKEVCYTCHCLSTVGKSGSLTHWAGNACSKSDISTPFWLFAGFTIVMLGILTFGISLLFSLGEEKLPGVIGAGVSKSK